MLLLTAAGFLSTVFMFILGYLISLGKNRNERIFYMLNMGAYNIGNFTLPFVSGFLGAAGTVATCLFDMGNAVMCVGGNLVFTQIAVDGKRGGKGIVRSLLVVFTKPSFTIYVIMMILAVIGIKLPSVVFDFAAAISPANGVLAMFMIGLMFEFTFDRKSMREVATVTVLRLILSVVIAYCFFNFTSFPYEIRKAVAVTAFAPISSAAGAFVQELHGDQALEGFASTVSIILSLVIIPVLIAVL